MKKTLKILSWICAVVLIFGTVSVGMTAYAGSDDVIGSYDFEISNVYKDIVWDNVGIYKGSTHVHTVRSDADTEIDDMIHYYYDDFGYDAMALTDHGTVNYGWDHDQTRVVLYDYQWFVHGTMDELSESDYKNIITGARNSRGYGMMEIPLGIEWNGASTKKYHVNGYYCDAGHGDLSILDNQDDAILGAIKGNYNEGGFSHVNHVGEWSGGNDEKEVYSQGWVENFASYFQRYCPNKGGRGAPNQGTQGVIGMELVNTADSRTHNDRRYVYDEILKILAPQGINVFGFCEDDAHEKSDCDRNAQYFLINKNKDVKITSELFDRSNNNSGSTSDYQNNDSDPMDKVQNYYRDAMFYGEFYASSKNSKNSYELGNGFVANGDYPSVSNISVDNDKDQISVTFKDATKVRLVADGTIIETAKTGAGTNTVVFDLNNYEHSINGYVRIYLTGAGGITYLQPFLVSKTASNDSTVQFVSPDNDSEGNPISLTSDIEVVVRDSNDSVVDTSWSFTNFFYKLPAGTYSYTASRRGYQTKTASFEVTQADIDNAEQIKIPVSLEENSDVSYAYFYVPETIYVTPNDNKTFDKYVDRENAVNGAIHTTLQNTGNIFFQREGATDLKLSCNVIEGQILADSIMVDSTNIIGTAGGISYSDDTISTKISSGALAESLVPDAEGKDYVLLRWNAKYKLNGNDYESNAYTYVYRTPTGSSDTLGAGAYVKTIGGTFYGWSHSTMYVAASVFASGVQEIVHNNTDGVSYGGYRYAPNSGFAFVKNSTDLRISTGKGYIYQSKDSDGGSQKLELTNNDIGYIYVDRSRINDWSQIPYLKIGFDFNAVDETTGEKGDSGSYGVARLLFDTSLTAARDATYHDDDVLFNLYFPNNKSNYTRVTDYNLTDGTNLTETGSVSNCLETYGSQRFYMSDNSVSSKTLVAPLPSATVDEVIVPVSAYVKGTKESRRDEICLEIDLCIKNVDKGGLRTELNNTIKDAYQEAWFPTDAEYDNYMLVIQKAAKVLGNPVSTAEQIETAKEELMEVYDNFTLKTGTYTVKHYWKLGNQTGEIFSENTTTYSYGEDLAANAMSITGYTYANEFVCEARDQLSDWYEVDRGIADFDLAFAEKDAYRWIFYYTPNSYTANYVANGAENLSDFSETVYFGRPHIVAEQVASDGINPQRTGYSFEGWYLDLSDKNYATGADDIKKWDWTSNAEFVAQWKSMDYKIEYDVDGGFNPDGSTFRVPDSYKTVHYGEDYVIYDVKIPEKTGYNFMGWQLNEGEVYLPGNQVSWNFTAETSTFKALWEIADYTVTFDKNASDAVLKDGSGTVLGSDYSLTVNYGSPYGTLPEAVRTGYTYEWYASSGFAAGTNVSASSNVLIDTDHTLYAKWTPIDYTITYNLDGGAVSGTNPATYTVEDEINLLDPVKTGYNFLGWSSADFSGYRKNYTIPAGSTGNKTFTANWELNGYAITYNLDGGINDANNPDNYMVSDTVVLQAPTKTGYRFLGWTGDNGDTPATSVTIPAGSTGDKNYTAHWELERYIITYNYNGVTDTPDNPASYTVEDAAFELVNPEKFGYTFAGWECSDDSLSGKTVTITPGEVTGNLDFKAMWMENGARKVTYILNGGVVEGTNPAGYKDGIGSSIIAPKKDGYNFAGWIKTIGTGTPEPASMNAVITGYEGADLTFTATWTKITYPITYQLNGGVIMAANGNPETYDAETPAFTLNNPVRAGYTFDGWTGTKLTSAAKIVTVPTGSTGNRAYTANWTARNYTVTYDLSGGADTGLIKKYTSATNATIGAPVKSGCTFTGWNVSYIDFDWSSGAISSAGKFISQSGSFVSDGIVLRSGSTYTIDGPVSGVKLYAYDKSGSFLGEFSGSCTPAADSVVYLTAAASSASELRQVKVVLSGATPTSIALTKETSSELGSAGNMSLTANWADDVYTITYEGLDGATVSGNPSTYTYNSADILLNNPTRAGYTFTGWEYNGRIEKTVTIRNHSTGNRTYTAIFEKRAYKITYSGIEGATVVSNPAVYYIDSSTITLNNPSKTGFTFNGWVGTGYTVATDSVTIPTGSTGNRNYTATWTADSYSITYNNVSGATFTTTNPNSYTIETETFTLKNPAKTGATFTGWKVGNTDDILLNVTIAKGSTGNKTYTAQWDYTNYAINYYLEGGTAEGNPTTYNATSAPITLVNPTRSGYIFAGWSGTGIDGTAAGVTIPTGSTGIRNYTANWQAINYRISYDLDGGEVADNANPTIYNIETTTINLVNPVKAGANFEGWTGTGLTEPTMDVSIPTGSTGTRNYTATWSDDNFTITYYGVEGATFPSENRTTYTVATNTFTLVNPTKRGYHFDGWQGTGISGSGISDSVTIPKGSSGNRTYTATWSLETYEIVYNLEGGTEPIANPVTYTINNAPFTLYAPVLTGSEFAGWESDYFSGTQMSVTVDPSVTSGDLLFTATWVTGNYTISLDAKGGTLPSGQETETINYTYNDEVTIPTPTKTGYTFAGWTGTGLTSATTSLVVPQHSTGNRSYVATWVSSNENTITYNLNGGEVLNGQNPTSYVTDSGTIILVNPTKNGYKFAGWTKDNDANGIVEFKNSDSKKAVINTTGGSAVLSATWTPSTYRIIYNLNGGTASNPQTYDIEQTVTLNNPVRTGYTFGGWIGTDLDETKANTRVVFSNKTGNRTYTAIWNEENYTITYDYNGGSTSEPNPLSYTVVSPSFTLNNPVKDGYTFTGWTGSNGDTPQKTITISTGSTGTRTYTANFSSNTYTIKYFDVDKETETYTVEDTPLTIADPEKAGYEFLGWSYEGSVNLVKGLVLPQGTTGNKELTAKWKEAEYTITYNLDGGSVSGTNPETYNIESADIKLVNPTKAGFVFKGWSGTDIDGFSTNVTIAKGSSGNREYTANWDTAPFRISYSGLPAGAIEDLNLPTGYTAAEAKSIPDAAMAGYTFLGWTGTDLSKATKNLVIPQGSTGNRTYKATWRIEDYDLNVNLNGGTTTESIPTTYNIDSPDIKLPVPRMEGYKFIGWTGSNGNTPEVNVTIAAHSTGNREYTANWTARTGDTHRIYFRGYQNAPLYVDIVLDSNGKVEEHRDYIDVPIGKPVENSFVLHPETIDTTAGYTITGWNIDVNDPKYMELNDDITVNAICDVGPDTYSVVANGTSTTSGTYGQFEKVTVTTAYSNDSGELFSYWVAQEKDANGNVTGSEIASYYRNYTFYAHADVVLLAVYGKTEAVRASTRITTIEEYDPNYDWFTPNSERSVATELTMAQHGIIFTDNTSVGSSENNFILDKSGVYNGVSKTKGLTGTWALSIPNPYMFGETIYVRSYVTVIDENGSKITKYSAIKTYINDQDITADGR